MKKRIIKKMSEKFDIPEHVINHALGLPSGYICPATTAKEAMAICEDVNKSPEEVFFAKLKWHELARIEIGNASTLEEIYNLYDFVPDEPSLQYSAVCKWEKLAMKEIRKANTPFEIRSMYSFTQECSRSRLKAYKKWNKLSLKELKECNSLSKIYGVYFGTPPDSEACVEAKKKWNKLAKKALSKAKKRSQIEKVYELSDIETNVEYLSCKMLAKYDVNRIDKASSLDKLGDIIVDIGEEVSPEYLHAVLKIAILSGLKKK